MSRASRTSGGFLPFLGGLAVGMFAMAGIVRWLDPGAASDLVHYRAVRDLVEKTFARPVGRDELLDDALGGLVGGLDPYSHYYPAAELAGLDRETGGTYTGIGAILTSDARVLWPWPGSPAERSGLAVGDRLLVVDGTRVADMPGGGFEQSLRRGPEHELILEVESRGGEPRQVRLRPEEVVEPSVRHSRLVDEERGIGYVSLHGFTRRTPDELDGALRGLSKLVAGSGKLSGLVLDLRANPGGVLPAAVEVANRFVRAGTLVSTVSRSSTRETLAEPERAAWFGLPLVVLIDGGSASASEVLAGALQDHRAGAIVGERSYGKGVVQSLNRFERREAVVKLTSGYYVTPSGRLIDRAFVQDVPAGIEPDLVIPLTDGERRDLHGWLASYGPPHDALAALLEWERAEGSELFPRHPRDPQLGAALELLRGNRPGPRLALGDGPREALGAEAGR